MPDFTKLTKIVATVGPATDSPDAIEALIKTGVNVFRFNTKHNSVEWHLEHIDMVRAASQKLGVLVGVMVDLQGPEIRIGLSADSEDTKISLSAGQEVFFAGPGSSQNSVDTIDTISPETHVVILRKGVVEALETGDKFTLEDGRYSFEVAEKTEAGFRAVVLTDKVTIRDNQGMNVTAKSLDLPSLSDEDILLLEGIKNSHVDFLALSFTRSAQDLDNLRKEASERGISSRLVAKIECRQALDNLDEIIGHSDGIMIARGDLGIEIPPEEIPHHQKVIINKCRNASIPVIVATQMLQSMVDSPLPTRAEVADVANAVYDKADAVMLSGETAVGSYPVEAAEIMAKTISHNENHLSGDGESIPALGRTHAVVGAALSMLEPFSGVAVDKLVVGTQTGFTARVFSSYRPTAPVLALSDEKDTVGGLTLSYGVLPVYVDLNETGFSTPDVLIAHLKERGLLHQDEIVLLVHGRRIKDPGNTNSLSVQTVA
jgi:pyruvate kinase